MSATTPNKRKRRRVSKRRRITINHTQKRNKFIKKKSPKITLNNTVPIIKKTIRNEYATENGGRELASSRMFTNICSQQGNNSMSNMLSRLISNSPLHRQVVMVDNKNEVPRKIPTVKITIDDMLTIRKKYFNNRTKVAKMIKNEISQKEVVVLDGKKDSNQTKTSQIVNNSVTIQHQPNEDAAIENLTDKFAKATGFCPPSKSDGDTKMPNNKLVVTNSNLESTSKKADVPQVISLDDSSICIIDDTCNENSSSTNNDSDVIFVSRKRKSECVVLPPKKQKHKPKNSDVIVIDDDEDVKFVNEQKSDTPKRPLQNVSHDDVDLSPIELSGKRITRSMRLSMKKARIAQNENALKKFTSTPKTTKEIGCNTSKFNDSLNKKRTSNTMSTHFSATNTVRCTAKPNLATIPEEQVKKSPKQTSKSNQKENKDVKFVNEHNMKNLFGNNFYNGGKIQKNGLRLIVVDGSNVALGHSNGKFFSVRGLKICIDYFLQRGHRVKAFVPQFRAKLTQSSDQQLLNYLHSQGYVVYTPSRDINGKRIVSYDDRFIVQCAAMYEGIVVSNDNFRDLMLENPSLKPTIEQRLLMCTWVDDMIIFPPDPLGRFGPSLDTFLRFP